MSHIHEKSKQFINKFRGALYNCDATQLQAQLCELFAPDCVVHLAFPFEDLAGADGLFGEAYQPLLTAVPDLERRDFIFMAGGANGHNWVGCCGHYMGVMERPFLDIPPSQHAIAMRYHEFFRIEDQQIVEVQAIWDIPQLMMQANAWPLAPSLGVEWVVPGPATQDGIITTAYNQIQADTNVKLVLDMLTAMGKYPQNSDPAVMQLEKYWHPKMFWYGPAGIGTSRGIQGFRDWHQTPFLKAMPDRRGAVTDADIFFGDGDYVGTTGWPNMEVTITDDGWMGIAPTHKSLTMRSLDFWRIENNLIRENWVLVDLLHIYDQIGVDVFSRMREVTRSRQ